jgi:hypothetical protein
VNTNLAEYRRIHSDQSGNESAEAGQNLQHQRGLRQEVVQGGLRIHPVPKIPGGRQIRIRAALRWVHGSFIRLYWYFSKQISMQVADVHRTLLYGGIFMYPATSGMSFESCLVHILHLKIRCTKWKTATAVRVQSDGLHNGKCRWPGKHGKGPHSGHSAKEYSPANAHFPRLQR